MFISLFFRKKFLIGNCISDKGANFALKSNIIMDTNDSEERIPTHRELWNKCKKLLQQRLDERKYQTLKDVESRSFDNTVLTLAIKDFRMVEKLEKLFDIET